MFQEILRYSQEGRYLGIVEKSAAALARYAALRGQEDEEAQAGRDEARRNLEELMIDCAWPGTEGGEAYINVEKEFFREGGLDPDRLTSFQKELVKQSSKEQALWCFAATSSALGPISARSMEAEGKDRSTLLPGALRHKRLKQKEAVANAAQESSPPEEGIERDAPVVRAWIYPDSSVRSEYDPSKARLRLDALSDRSGYDWSSAYSPNNSVERAGWNAGFNQNDEWMRFEDAPAEEEKAKASIFIGPDSSPEIAWLVQGEEAFLDDSEGALAESEIKEYYDIAGRPYGRLRSDAAATATKLSKAIAAAGGKRLATIIVRPGDSGALSRYQSLFPGLVDKATKLVEKQARVREGLLAHNGDAEILRRLEQAGRALAALGSGREEILRALSDGPSATIESPLALEHGRELEVFLRAALSDESAAANAADAANADIDVEGLSAEIRELAPSGPEARAAYTRASLNILASPVVRTAFKNAGISMPQLLERIAASRSGKRAEGKLELSAETSLYDILTRAPASQERRGSLSFTRSHIPASANANFESAKSQAPRASETTGISEISNAIPVSSSEPIDASLAPLFDALPPGPRAKAQASFLSALKQQKAIAMSTGMKVDELAQAAIALATGSADEAKLRRKRVFFELDADEVIQEAAQAPGPRMARSLDELAELGSLQAGSIQAEGPPAEGLQTASPDLDESHASEQENSSLSPEAYGEAALLESEEVELSSQDLQTFVLKSLDETAGLSEAERSEAQAALANLRVKQGELSSFLAKVRQSAGRSSILRRPGWVGKSISKAMETATGRTASSRSQKAGNQASLFQGADILSKAGSASPLARAQALAQAKGLTTAQTQGIIGGSAARSPARSSARIDPRHFSRSNPLSREEYQRLAKAYPSSSGSGAAAQWRTAAPLYREESSLGRGAAPTNQGPTSGKAGRAQTALTRQGAEKQEAAGASSDNTNSRREGQTPSAQIEGAGAEANKQSMEFVRNNPQAPQDSNVNSAVLPWSQAGAHWVRNYKAQGRGYMQPRSLRQAIARAGSNLSGFAFGSPGAQGMMGGAQSIPQGLEGTFNDIFGTSRFANSASQSQSASILPFPSSPIATVATNGAGLDMPLSSPAQYQHRSAGRSAQGTAPGTPQARSQDAFFSRDMASRSPLKPGNPAQREYGASPLSPDEERMQRLNQAYDEGKRMLAKEDSGTGSRPATPAPKAQGGGDSAVRAVEDLSKELNSRLKESN